MWQTNLKILGIVVGTLALYTFVSSAIPQVASEVPEELSFSADVSPEELVAAGEELYNGAGGCTACHGLGTRAPHLVADEAGTGTIGQRCAGRVPGEDCKIYLYQSMIEPTAFVVPGYQPIMPDMRRTLSETQIWSVIAFLQSLGGEVTVTGADMQDAFAVAEGGATEVAVTAPGAAGPSSTASDPRQIMQDNLCFGCHQLAGEGVALGPTFDGIGGRRTPEHIRQSILDPNADADPAYAQLKGAMPPIFGNQLSAAQLEAVVQFLASQR